MQLKQFILKTVLLVFITSVLCIIIFKFFFPEEFLLLYPFLPVLFGFINIFIFKTLIKSKDFSLFKFSNRYMLFTTLKLLGSILFIIGFLFFNKEQAIPFLSSFLVIYLIFLAQEIIGILKFFKKNEKSETTHAKT
jgi:predicted membrane channel-forming protein YqfA (hemolysin III family)